MLDGSLRVIESKSYRPDASSAGFNALAVIRYDPAGQIDMTRSYADGWGGDFSPRLTAGCLGWQMPIGSGAVICHVATVVEDHRR